MAISRPLLIALVVSVVALAVVMAMRAIGGSEQGRQSAASPTAQAGLTVPSPAARSARAPARAHPRDASARRARTATGEGPQARVLRAIAQHKVVVLFFGQQTGADDAATRRAVREVASKRRDAAVFVASIKDVARYPRVVAGLGIQQSPSTVVIDRSGQARLVEGFLDEGSLVQLVADAH